ncbi:hypothetical protein CENSYa_1334 [Cenarchaeum symbiosum A]|uniref:Uncharacterized protein n=1 Tax=Cenarchaeum symbiosum (strain A) TaxID=414004 RepID=A0RX90_CENSY|nr:hypothetical protein CENSYa_1334 [Cenarchaeum symbiosum A]
MPPGSPASCDLPACRDVTQRPERRPPHANNLYKRPKVGAVMPKLTYGMALTGSAAILALLALTPAGAQFQPSDMGNGPELYGMAELVHRDADGKLIASQTVHNTLVDSGEDILVRGTFVSTALPDVDKPDALCITDIDTGTTTDSTTGVTTAVDPDVFTISNNTISVREDVNVTSLTPNSTTFAGGLPTCIPATVALNDIPGEAVLNATFTGGTNLVAGATVTAVSVCNSAVVPADNADCASRGDLFSVITIASTTLIADQTLEVTYIFDVTSPDS